GKQLYDWWHEASERSAADARQQEFDQKTIAEAMKIVNGPVRDVAEAMQILSDHAAQLRIQNAFVGPQIEDITLKTRALSEEQKIAAATADIQKVSYSNLSNGLLELINKMFDAGYSTAEAIKVLKDHELYLEEDKVAIENLHKVYDQHQKDLR